MNKGTLEAAALPADTARVFAPITSVHYGNYLLAYCPFHDDQRPSLLIYARRFECKACGATGGLSDLHFQMGSGYRPPEKPDYQSRGVYAPEGAEDLHPWLMAAHQAILDFPSLGWWLQEKRGLADQIIPRRLGWYKGWITVPITSLDGSDSGVVMRATPAVQAATGQRFLLRRGQRAMPYCPDWKALTPTRVAFIVFGVFDALSLSVLGYPVITSTNGKDNFHIDWVPSYPDFVVVVPDAGEEDVAKHLAARFADRGRVLHLKYPQGKKDPNGFLELGKGDELRAQLDEAVLGLVHERQAGGRKRAEHLGCGEPAPRRIRCGRDEACVCTLARGHTTPHRAGCGAKWRSK